MKAFLKVLMACTVLLAGIGQFANATPVDTYQFKDEANQKHAMELARTLRCPQCQNQDIVDSNSPVARDLRMEVYKMVDAGKSDDEIIKFMTNRYGDFVLYKPRLDSKTYILWLGPIALLLFGGLIAFFFIRKQRTVVAVEDISDEDQQKLAELLKKGS